MGLHLCNHPMINVTSTQNSSSGKSKKGFALVMALSLMSLVFLLVVSLVSLVSTDLNLTELRKQKVLAQANAKMGMMIAIGELQKHLGPDTRVTATADILDERIQIGADFSDPSVKYTDNMPTSEWIDLNENFRYDPLPFGQRNWTGVWKRSLNNGEERVRPLPNTTETGNAVNYIMENDSEYDPHPAMEVAWLVSGNEGYEPKLAILNHNGLTIDENIEIPDAMTLDHKSAIFGPESLYAIDETPG